jgi:hypothetical protein
LRCLFPEHLLREQACQIRTRRDVLELRMAGRSHRLKRSRGTHGDDPRVGEMVGEMRRMALTD